MKLISVPTSLYNTYIWRKSWMGKTFDKYLMIRVNFPC